MSKRLRWGLLGGLVLLILVVGGAAALLLAGPPTYSDESVPITVAPGGDFAIRLASNATTGYRWELHSAPDSAVVTLRESRYDGPDAPLVGAGGHEVWTFHAVAPGQTTIGLRYAFQDHAPTRPTQDTVFTVIVR
ncbi:MAG TPA: protease inhibitor I42 family protein [Chloroflexia bacterium]